MSRTLPGVLLGTAVLMADGSALFSKHCESCHARYFDMEQLSKNYMESNNTLLNLKAPTLNQIRFRVKQRVGDPSGDAEFHRIEVVDFISGYVMEPDREKSVCLPEVMHYFETMKSLKGKISARDLDEVANWIYDEEENR